MFMSCSFLVYAYALSYAHNKFGRKVTKKNPYTQVYGQKFAKFIKIL